MTLGIAAHGPQAGAAIHQAVVAAELLGHGEIGGFVVFSVIDTAGHIQQCSVQQGGITALNLPADWLAASQAAVITSGPQRPEPLTQFLPGRHGAGLVTGHRLPNRPDMHTGWPLNTSALGLMAAGMHPQAAVDELLKANPQADAGLIAINPQGQIGCANSARVAQRPDAGQARWHDAQAGFALLHNAIYAGDDLAACLGSMLRAALQPNAANTASHQLLALTSEATVEIAASDAVHVDAQWHVQRVASADPFMAQATQNITLLPLATPVLHNGRLVGHMATELFAEVAYGIARPSAIAKPNLALVRRLI
ncbi:MAG: hypothetical protein RSD57_10765 [Comamonas sp.]